MRFNGITLKNFGPFYGEHFLNFESVCESSPTGTVILVGGKNGAGKTTIFEAIRLCLHGKQRFSKSTQNEYFNHIAEKINDTPNTSQTVSASVQVSIELTRHGKNQTYEIIRSWKLVKSKVKEELVILENGGIPESIFPDQYQSFLNELVPIGLADLFFFDGERIQSLADETESGPLMSESIRSLLGLNITARLRSDLTTLIRTKSPGEPSQALRKELQSKEKSILEIENKIDGLTSQLLEQEERVEELAHQVQESENALIAEGGEFAKHRQELLREQTRLTTEIEICKNLIRNEAAEYLPILAAPNICKQLISRLKDEEIHSQNHISETVIGNTLSKINKNLSEVLTGKYANSLSPGLKKDLQQIMGQALRDSINAGQDSGFVARHDLTQSERANYISIMERALNEVTNRVLETTSTLLTFDENLQQINSQIERIPDENYLAPLLTTLQKETSLLSEEKAKWDLITESLQKENFHLTEEKREHDKISAQIDGILSKTEHMTLAARARSALLKYEDELKLSRARTLGEITTRCLRTLLRKSSLCEKVEFNPITFSLRLFGPNGKSITKQNMSAGEKQVLAISLLWALSKMSKRDIPIIIDTPLARLDTDHRNNLVESYFPVASSQVVILSTDTEINGELLDLLEPHLSSVFSINSSDNGSSKIEEKYFNMLGHSI